MKNKTPISLLICLSLFMLPIIKTQNLVTGDYPNMNGIQVYFVTSSSVYLFGSFSGSASTITGTLYLFMSDSQSSIDGSNGVWAGVGFGSSDMINNDIVMCTYMPGNKFNCYDTWSTSNNNPKSDTSLGGKNDITASSGTITSVSVGSYKTLVTFTFTKDISNLDKFDWSNFASWQTNNGGVAGAYGYLNGSKIPLEHPAESKRLSLTDGSGYRSSITVNLGGNVNASAAVPTTTTPTAVPTTTTPTAVPTTTTPTDGTTGTTKSSMGSSNGAQGLKYFEVFAAIFAIFLIAFI